MKIYKISNTHCIRHNIVRKTGGAKVNINYYLNDKIDEDVREEIFDYFKSIESTDLKFAYKELKEENKEASVNLDANSSLSFLSNNR
jgi:ATP-dependent DNA helicase RecQ